jgi:hypothetical protein
MGGERKSPDLVPEAGGHPARLVTAAAEYIRAANHATINALDVLNPGLLAGVHAYDTVGALFLLTSRLPQLCRQLAEVLDDAGDNGTLTGPKDAPEYAARELHDAAETLRGAAAPLNTAWQLLGGVGGWLSADAEAAAGDGGED